MPVIPAFCDNCGTPFPSGIFAENCLQMTMTGNRSGPCPKCGGMGSVPDGVFNVLGNAIEIINAPSKTIEQLQRYAQVLDEAKEQRLSREEVKQKINEEVPEFSSVSQYLPKSRSELYAFLALIVSILAYVTPLMMSDDGMSESDVESLINNSVQQMLMQQEIERLSRENKELKGFEFSKPSRNSDCSCGSTKKYKNCCGQLI
ncbi:SEC-C metal-binding domain-containing protein [Vibrio campbellii]|uniref:SEC-C metal-binding domain-containing protein n=1 Tax=Vibrio campbellii TaxID=680 RepID=UPI001E4ED39A|nr:SEC-C metal-binding domain-containing protein [Vibrio campbellii]MCC8256646.1 SEC-C domain-containing protein [Vibrio campbellii CAIM 333]